MENHSALSALNESSESASPLPQTFWDKAIAAARARKDAFVDNPDGGVVDASNVLWGMFEIINAIEAARDRSPLPTAEVPNCERGISQSKECLLCTEGYVAVSAEVDKATEYSREQLRAMATLPCLQAHLFDYYGAVKQLFAALTERGAYQTVKPADSRAQTK